MSMEQDIITEIITTLKTEKFCDSRHIDKLDRDLSTKVMTEEDWNLFLEVAVEKSEEDASHEN